MSSLIIQQTRTPLLSFVSLRGLALVAVGALAIAVQPAQAQEFSAAEKLAMGQGLFEQNGSNSCMYCHGIDGKGGKVAAAAHLDVPKSWRGYRALGGDAAFAKDKAAFVAALKKATVHLIEMGAVSHNMTYKEAGFDLGKAGGPFNAQMLGISGAPSAQWIKKYEGRGVTKHIASEAVFDYLASLDTQGVFK